MNNQPNYKAQFFGVIAIVFFLLCCALGWRLSKTEKAYKRFGITYENEIKAIDEDFSAVEAEKKEAFTIIAKLEKQNDSISKAAKKERNELLNAAWKVKKEYAAKKYTGVVEQPDTNLLCFGEAGVDSLNAAAIDFNTCKEQSKVKDSTITTQSKIIAQDSTQIALGEQKSKVHTEHVKALQKSLGKETRLANLYQGLTVVFGTLAAVLALK